MLIWCLKQFKDFILKLSMSGSFFPQRKFLNLYTMILSSFALGRYVDEVVAIKQIIKDTSTFISSVSDVESPPFHE